MSLGLGVDNASVRILDAKIQLGNGTVITRPIRAVLYPGQRTHVFRLPGTIERHITSLVLYYETGNSARSPHTHGVGAGDAGPAGIWPRRACSMRSS